MSTPPSAPPASPPVTAPPADPAAYLTGQADHAKSAFLRAFSDFKATITSPLGAPAPGSQASGSPSPGGASVASRVMSDHPYAALTGALASGFIAAAVVVPSKEQQTLRKLAALERAVALHGPDTAHPRKPGGLMGSLLGSVMAVVKPALLQMVTAALAAHTATEVVEAKTNESNGHAPDGTSPPSSTDYAAEAAPEAATSRFS